MTEETKGNTETERAGRSGLSIWFRIIALLLLISTVFGFYLWGRGQHNRSYGMPPAAYYEQARLIRKGMTAAEVRSHLRGVTRVSSAADRVSFAMEPRSESVFAFVSHFIVVHLDGQGRVVKVTTHDG